ncbi:MAG: LemA family protein [Enterococcus sp.]|nr:LemA family protein [Enterococcus sp.]
MEFSTIIIIIAIILLIAIWIIAGKNSFISKKNDVEEAFSTMDIYLKKRYDLIPNLVETVKGYAGHERDTLEAVMKARSMANSDGSIEQRIDNEKAFSSALSRLMAVAENYPDLKASENFRDLQNELSTIEGEIANARKYYNATVKYYNNRVMIFPNSILAGIFHFEKLPMYEVSNEAERENVKVKF